MNLNRLRAGALGLLISAGTIAPAHADDAKFEAVKNLIEQRMNALKVPGIAFGILHDGKVEMAGLGVTNFLNPQPVDEHTQFKIGSLTKAFTSTTVLKMADRGEVDLNAPLRQYMPDFVVGDIEATENAKVIDLFQHRTGWRGDYFDNPSSGEDALEKAMLAFRFLPQRTPYGEVWAYNNNNLIIAGRLIQVISRAKSYEERVKEEILLPLGMSRTSFFVDELLTDRIAAGHGAVFDGVSEPAVSYQAVPRASNPSGGLISNVNDLTKWVQFQLDGNDKDGNQLLSPELRLQAQSPLVVGELNEHTGITWFVEDIADVRTVNHTGRIPGYTTKVLFVPDEDFGIVVLTNGDRGIEVYEAAIALALKEYLGIEKDPLTPVADDSETLADFVGTWIGDMEDYRFYYEGDELMTQRLFKPLAPGAPKFSDNPPPVSISSAGEDLGIMTDGPYQGTVGELLRDKDGKPSILQMQHRVFLLEK